ncbi:Heparan-alpha-glucosaminide N-acetyltransferase [Eumeta japonica]|uniref:Heparan-alpha-glucosaminide N-acetyltransferase n=1 Tax=Eumeta variegata TaxID=151549 RepID=A0A4C1WX91_EUMVA|nr:Heparan-alpha-glucosaminide N-acetyltransferase [Eumeta japonica]
MLSSVGTLCCPAAFGEAGTAFQLTALPTHHLFGGILSGVQFPYYLRARAGNKTILHLTNVVQLLNDDVAHSHADGLHACCIDLECATTTLRYDEACLHLLTNTPISFWSQYTECEGCVLQETVKAEVDKDIVIRTLWPLQYEIRDHDGSRICNGTYQFGEFGQYEINVTDNMKDECLPKMTAQPDAAYLPILSTIVTLLAMATLWYIVKGIGKRIVAGQLYSRYFAREDNELGSETRVLTSETNLLRSPTRSRLRSLDIFRGAAIAMMIFVNSGGGGYAVFTHTVWNGLTIADVVFPCFAFAMGEALVLSLNARLRTAMSRTTALVQVARRSLVMAMIGVLLGSANVNWNNLRLPGVLQRLAAMYFIVGAIECAFINVSQNIRSGMSLIRDITNGWKQWLVTFTLVAIQVGMSLGVEAPGCPVGYLGPGGLHLSASGKNLQNCTGGIAGYIDRLRLGVTYEKCNAR